LSESISFFEIRLDANIRFVYAHEIFLSTSVNQGSILASAFVAGLNTAL
jgi:hypothetical protein